MAVIGIILDIGELGHFQDAATGVIHDVDFKPGINLADVLNLPPGAVIDDIEITLRGKLTTPLAGHPQRRALRVIRAGLVDQQRPAGRAGGAGGRIRPWEAPLDRNADP